MKILPLYRFMAMNRSPEGWPTWPATFFEGRYPKRTMVLVLEGDEEFPAGTPRRTEEGILVFRGEINHFHDATGFGDIVPAGNDPQGFAIAPAKRLSQGRRRMRRFLAKYRPVSRAAQRHALR